jgi:hypothetical protein
MYSNHKAPRKVSRRAVLGTAGVGALGAAAAGVGIVVIRDNDSPSNGAAAVTAAGEGTSAVAMVSADTENNPIVVYLPNPESNRVQIFAGTDHREVRNEALAQTVRDAAAQ